MSDHEGANNVSTGVVADQTNAAMPLQEAPDSPVSISKEAHNGADVPADETPASAPLEAVSQEDKPAQSNLEDTLFGDDDDEEEEEQVRARSRINGRAASSSAAVGPSRDSDEDEDDEDEGVRRQVRRIRQRVDSASASPPPGGASGAAPIPPPLAPSSPAAEDDMRSARSSRSGSPYSRAGSQEMDDETRRQLEYKEDDEDLPAEDNIEVAHLALPQLPVRHSKEHWLARIPHFLRYVTTPFDANAWDEEQEEELLRLEGFSSGFGHDLGATSLLRTSNTIRWRYTDQRDEDGARVPEPNARIVRWSDGTMSLQVGSELFDITQQTEQGRVSTANTGANTPQPVSQSQSAGPSSSQQLLAQATQSMPMGSRGSGYRPAQSLSYLVVPHTREGVMESQGPIAGSLAFTPADTRSETHRRIAKALRFQKTARVVATAAGEGALDPEIEKARIEKELKDAEKKRIREREKADRKSGKLDDEMFDIETRRRSRYVGGRKLGAGPRNADYYSDESDIGGGGGGVDEDVGRGAGGKRGYASQRYAEDDDGFIVDDEGDDDEDADGAASGRRKKQRNSDDEDAMEVDDEPDEMELAEQRIEEAERARKKAAAAAASGEPKPRRPEPAFSSDDEADDDADADRAHTAAASRASDPDDGAGAGSQTITKKKRIIESDEE